MEAEGVSHKKKRKEERGKHFAIFGKWEEEEEAQPHRTGQQTRVAQKSKGAAVTMLPLLQTSRARIN